MKWNKLLWLSSLAAAVEESRRRKERGRLHAHETAHYTKKKKKKKHSQTQIHAPWYCPGLYLSLTITEQADNG